jgi:RHS repeat-associated protein
MTSPSGQVTYAKSYDPYGVVTQASGEGQSAYGFTGEQQDSYSGMVYLRSRYYNVADGRFQSRDTWGGDANSPMSFNHWIYVEGNSINYTDPSGLCPNCYIFYFPGVGNPGDTNGDNNLEDNLDSGEKAIVGQLRERTNSNVSVVYPYAIGNLSPFSFLSPDIMKYLNIVPVLKAIFGKGKIPGLKAEDVKGPIGCWIDNAELYKLNKNIKISFIGYSGGTQMAYAIAQKLSGIFFIDNLIQIGPVYAAYNGTNNIGKILELIGEDDDRVAQTNLLHDYNKYEKKIYDNGAVICDLFGSEGHPYTHTGKDSYMDVSAPANGMVCRDNQVHYSYSGSRNQAIIEFLINNVHVGENP